MIVCDQSETVFTLKLTAHSRHVLSNDAEPYNLILMLNSSLNTNKDYSKRGADKKKLTCVGKSKAKAVVQLDVTN